MIVKQDEYEKMKAFIMGAIQKGHKITACECGTSQYNVEAVISLHSQLLLRYRKADSKKVVSCHVKGAILCQLRNNHKEKTTLHNLSNELGIGGYKMAKIALEMLLEKAVSIPHMIDNPYIVLDDHIREDILKCIKSDPLCNLESDQLKECSGKEYESLLFQQLVARNMCFETEADLRNRGKPKTPDILLLIPMGVQDFQEVSMKFRIEQHQQPKVINWIDSKGMFADEETFEENYEQLKSYVNRCVRDMPYCIISCDIMSSIISCGTITCDMISGAIYRQEVEFLTDKCTSLSRYGAGMVIYWHGFVESLTRLQDEMIFISDRFPDNWIFPTGEPADGRAAMFDRAFAPPAVATNSAS